MSFLKESVKASKYFPSYFKLDMRIGHFDQNPLVNAVDSLLLDYFKLRSERSFEVDPKSYSIEKKKELLVSFGYRVDELLDDQVDKFYERRLFLNSFENVILKICNLASIYFDVDYVKKYWPYQVNKIGKNKIDGIRVLENELDQKIVFIRTLKKYEKNIVDEFIFNSSLVLPHSFKVVVGFPLGHKKKNKSFVLDNNLKITRRRI